MAELVLGDVSVGDALPELIVDVTATTVVMGSAVMGDWAPAHHDRRFAVEGLGTGDIFLSTESQGAWFERYLTDWTGPRGRLGRLSFRMRTPVTAGSVMMLNGEVSGTAIDDRGCGWAEADLTISVDGNVASLAEARIAVPVDPDDNPWDRRAERWRP